MILALGMILDALLGEPKWLWDRVPHPAVLMGRLIGWADETFNAGDGRKMKGAVVIAVLLVGALVLGEVLADLPFVVEVVVIGILLAQKSLVTHVQDVADALRIGLGDGRQAVARIVGRDVAALDHSGVARSAIESAAENLSDGVVAPIFWYVIAGLPGLIAYKVLNTADSMIGYRTERHEEFGWAAARLDDLANWIPARLTALILWALAGAPVAWGALRQDAAHHRSPNAGWPEAAMAFALNVALSGPRVYHGQPTADRYINEEGERDIGPEDIDRSVAMLWKVWWVCLLIVVVVS